MTRATKKNSKVNKPESPLIATTIQREDLFLVGCLEETKSRPGTGKQIYRQVKHSRDRSENTQLASSTDLYRNHTAKETVSYSSSA